MATLDISNNHGSHIEQQGIFAPDCLQSLAFREKDDRFKDNSIVAFEGTCEWLLQHETYRRWAACDRDVLWIKGKPGSRKSTLLRYALDNVMEVSKIGERPLVLSFFFHGRGAELQRTPLGLFRPLLHQILSQVPDVVPDLVATFEQRCENDGKPDIKWQWHLDELRRFFKSSLVKVLESRPIWLFIDALDECGKENAVDLADNFNSLLQSLPSTAIEQIHICFSCRPYLNLDLNPGGAVIYVKEGNKQDISTYVKAKLSGFRVRMGSTIPDLIIGHAQGVFLWARLVVAEVLKLKRDGSTLNEIQKEIYTLPLELDDLYLELIQSMQQQRSMQKRSNSLKLIQWICFATRPLSLDELRAEGYADDNDMMERRVIAFSSGLAEVVPSSNARFVQFIHQSVKDFFVEKCLSALHASLKRTEADSVVGIAHYRLSRTCIRYLAMKEIAQSTASDCDGLTSAFPLLHYATTSWIAHVKQSETRDDLQDDLLDYFAWPSEHLVQRWARIYGIIKRYANDRPPERINMAHIVSRYQLIGPLRAILQKARQLGTDINTKDEYGRTPLLYAAERGYESVVKELLEKGVDPDSEDYTSRTPLWYAAEGGHEAALTLKRKKNAVVHRWPGQLKVGSKRVSRYYYRKTRM
ncbi:hypothetical protein BKA65DRAFT_522158 [Rhexocercosporidium sp. MPI-PUGE-AT-0058]|nr:hypothetical protein BKA65DRAFT_522158 [Rhexocercosporidium sp. MPI-PUGE-AT-0058]